MHIAFVFVLNFGPLNFEFVSNFVIQEARFGFIFLILVNSCNSWAGFSSRGFAFLAASATPVE